MAAETQTYPVLTASTWWKLRKKFNSTIPKELTATYLATALDMSESSAKTNVIPKLKLIGFINDDNKPTDLCIRWRDDTEYPKVCEELINKLYPSELPDAIDDPLNEKDKVVKWFQNRARVGESAAQMMTSFYLLLVDADPSKQNVATAKPEKSRSNNSASSNSEKSKKNPQIKENASQKPLHDKGEINKDGGFKPTIHLDIQIHISPDSSSDQIDKIFESMAKHLTGFKVQ